MPVTISGGTAVCTNLQLDIVNTLATRSLTGLPTAGPGTFAVQVQNAANIVNGGMKLTIGTGDNEEVVQVAAVAGKMVTRRARPDPHPPLPGPQQSAVPRLLPR